MKRKAINIVGAGIAGSITHDLLLRAGYTVRLFDDVDPCAASRASSNLYVDHWLKKFFHDGFDVDQGLNITKQLYGSVSEQPFEGGVAEALKVRRIPHQALLRSPSVTARVTAVRPDGVTTQEGRFYPGRTVVCAGYRAPELINLPGMEVKVGHCVIFRGRLNPGEASLNLVAPYKHGKLFQMDLDHIYYADSVALKLKSYQKRETEVRARTVERAERALGRRLPIVAFHVGYRPIVPGHPFGHLDQPMENVWTVNGGGKNGIVAYALLADKLRRILKGTT